MTALSVVIPTFKRTSRTIETITRLLTCEPLADEIIVHVDAGDVETAPAIRQRFPQIKVLTSNERQGPGGARNRLLAAAQHEIVVSLDDDSFPIDQDFFASVIAAFEAHPKAGILAMTIIHDDEAMIAREPSWRPVADFVGCGCAYRRSIFNETKGYVPVQPAYGMEEADIALQVLDAHHSIIFVDDLRVRHATNRSHQADRRIVAAHVKNTCLLVFLRYPFQLWPLGIAQYVNRIGYSLRRGAIAGVAIGIISTPLHVARYLKYRSTVNGRTIATVRYLRRQERNFSSVGPPEAFTRK